MVRLPGSTPYTPSPAEREHAAEVGRIRSAHERQRAVRRAIHDLELLYDLPDRRQGETDEEFLLRAIASIQQSEPTIEEKIAGRRGQQAGQWREQPWRGAREGRASQSGK